MPTVNLVDGALVTINAVMTPNPAEGTNPVVSSDSIVGNGLLDSPLHLFNDTPTPAPGQYYGTDLVGRMGWHNVSDALSDTIMLKSVYDVSNHGFVDRASIADSVPWSGVIGAPSIQPVGSLITAGSIVGGGPMTGNLTISLDNDVSTPGLDSFYGFRIGAKGWYQVPYSTLSGLPVIPTVGILAPFDSIQGGGSMQNNIGVSLVGDVSVPNADTFYGYHGGARGFFQIPYASLSGLPTIPTAGTLTTTGSLAGGGPLSGNLTLSLVGDANVPNADTFYGYHSGAKGFFQIPYSSLSGSPSIPTVGTLTTASSIAGGGSMTGPLTITLVNDTTTPATGQFYGYSGSARGWFTPPSFSSSTAGYVGASGGGTTNFLRADGAWTAPPGGGGTTYLTTASTFTIPAINTAVTVTVGSTADMVIGQVHRITDGNQFMDGVITAKSGTSVTYVNQGGNGAVSGTMAAAHIYMIGGIVSIDNNATHYLSGANTFLPIPTVGTLTTAGSLTGGGAMTGPLTVNLVNDNTTPGADTYYGYHGGAKGFFQIPYSSLGGLPTIPTVGTLTTAQSITGGGAMTGNLTVNLVGDTTTPTADTFYGYHSSTRGFFQVPYASLSGLPTIPSVGNLTTSDSITGGGAMTGNLTITLVGDALTPSTDTYYGYHGGSKGFFQIPYSSLFGLPTIPTVGTLTTANSLTGGGAMTGNLTINLVGDATTPSADTYYGYHGGAKGFFQIPYSSLGGLPSIPTVGTLTTSQSIAGGGSMTGALTINLVNDTTTPTNGQFYGYSGSARGWFTPPNVTSGAAGYAPASGGGTTNFLRADLSWSAPPTAANVTTVGTGGFTIPAIGSVQSGVPVVSNTWITAGQTLWISDGTHFGFFEVIAVASGTSISLRNPGYSINTTSGTTMAAGATVSLQGPAIASGTSPGFLPALDGNAAHFLTGTGTYVTLPANSITQAGTVATAPNDSFQFWNGSPGWVYPPHSTKIDTGGFTIPAIGAVQSGVPIISASWVAVGQTLWISDGTHWGFFEVTAVASSTSISLRNPGYTVNTASGTTMAAGAGVSMRGPAVASGTSPGFTPALSGVSTQYLSGAGTWTVPPGTAGGTLTVFSFEPSQGNPPASNAAIWGTRLSGGLGVWQFAHAGATDSSIVFVGIVPQGMTFATGIKVIINWASTTSTTGNCEWAASIDNASTHSIDTDSYGTAVSVATTTNGSAAVMNTTTINLPSANLQSLAAEQVFKVKITRRASDTTNDTMTDVASLMAVELKSY